MPFVESQGCCRICGRSVEGLKVDYLCEDCSGKDKPFFDRAGSALRFETETRELLLSYKFRQAIWLCEDLSEWLLAALHSRFDVAQIDLVMPMPTTLFHRLDRGYNQCSYLARRIAKAIDRKYDASILRRKGNPKRQSELTEDERRENARGTFSIRNSSYIKGRTILVIDDIMTTGSTLSECARALKEAGAHRVWCLTVARSLRQS